MNTLRFDHLGLACRELDVEQRALEPLGYRPQGHPFEDPSLGIRGQFLSGPGPRIELVTALPGSRVLDPWLSKGIKIYHQAYRVADLPSEMQALREAGAQPVAPPIGAVAFDGHPVAFLMLPNMLLIELIESP
jgi:methylmalonyl-CoA/ethylmalonyl-CoA epimerase